ncbi:MAG: alanine--tRNA ligase [Holosporales bacterium]|jgi:alanyl-tRNA synthetase|nr:alanine--tRNA ligase [Holosporales bacterium]
MSWTAGDIRSEFIRHFVDNGHSYEKSSLLVPENDPTLMFTNSGMVQFKDVFTGRKSRSTRRATTAQKCLRAGGKHNDLDNVGYTARHHTFFEMLGNFSFGDYFKAEAIEFAWGLISKVFGLPIERLLVTVHSSDEEAATLWRKIAGFEDSRIIRIPTNDNFWSMGDTGPCGPCTEIFYDHGSEIPGGPPGSDEADGDRFVEIWNLVFMQYETMPDGTRHSLPKPSIDTGMGLERIAAVLQGVCSNYDIDMFKSIIARISEVTGKFDEDGGVHHNVIADHLRAISFMITDGITPANEGRGYVLRRIIRRAIRHGYTIGMREPFLYRITSSVKDIMSSHYKELIDSEATIVQVVRNEEENFMKTIDNGMHILQTELERMGAANTFPAEIVYKLYDTYGFPFDLTQDVLKASGRTIDETKLTEMVAEQKQTSKKAWVGTGDSFTDRIWYDIAGKVGQTKFIRDKDSLESNVLAIVKDGQVADVAQANDVVFVITRETPFYAESGGQIGDIGQVTIPSCTTCLVAVTDTKNIGGIIAHECIVRSGAIRIGDIVRLAIDSKRRLACSRNHTATHILQAALKQILGSHVAQKGSLVTNERLRFDFIHNGTIDREQISEIEKIVIDKIDMAMNVVTQVLPVEEAKKSGAVALFGEKYPDLVRVVTIGEGFSKELCGGAHVDNTSKIGTFKIISVASIGSGIKRIEAATGHIVKTYLEDEIIRHLEQIDVQRTQIKGLEKQLSGLRLKSDAQAIELHSEQIGSTMLRSAIVCDVEHKSILGLIDRYKQSTYEECLMIGNESPKNQNISVCLFVTKPLASRFKINEVLEHLSNSSGLKIKSSGREDLAQFGGLSVADFEECLVLLKAYIGG